MNNHITSQWTTAGFMQRYDELLQVSRTYLDAYHATEAEHVQLFGNTRYRSPEAFRQVRRNLLTKKNV